LRFSGPGAGLCLAAHPRRAVEISVNVDEPWMQGQVAMVVPPPMPMESARLAALAWLEGSRRRQEELARELETHPAVPTRPQLAVVSQDPPLESA